MPKAWGFYGRTVEESEIGRIVDSGRWFFCAISGRRRIGKTTLIQQALRKRPNLSHFYFQVPDSDERGVVQAFQDALEDYAVPLDVVHQFRTFAEVASMISGMSRRGFIVIIDEFQYFHRKSLAPFTSFLQAEVDKLRDTPKGGLFVLGSIHTEMTAILDDRTSPLFNRVTHRIEIGHWDFETLFEMFGAHGVVDSFQQLFLWTLFEGVPKFYRDCFEQDTLGPIPEHRTFTLRRLFFEGASPLRDEAENWFLRELRGRYDSVLKLLAYKEPCSHGELMEEYRRAGAGGEKQLGGYLQTLIERYRMVEKLQPIFSTDKARKSRYVIADNFLSAWLRAIARNIQLARIQPIEAPIARADAALATFEGFTLEKMVRLLVEECSRKSKGDFPLTDLVRGYWNKPDGSDIEIDVVACNGNERRVRFGSCKRASSAHDGNALEKFESHINCFLATKEGRRFADWSVEKALYSTSFSVEDRARLTTGGYFCFDIADFRNLLCSDK